MCGIFGVIAARGSGINPSKIKQTINTLASHSLERGRDSSGIVFKNSAEHKITVIKGDVIVTELQRSEIYKKQLKANLDSYKEGNSFMAMGHARLVTNGSQLKPENNQPVSKDEIITIHNGIVVNTTDLWAANPQLVRHYDIDTEIIPALVRKHLSGGESFDKAAKASLEAIKGTASCALLPTDSDSLVLMSNNGSLYYIASGDILLFASEKYYVKVCCARLGLEIRNIKQVEPNSVVLIDTGTLNTEKYPLSSAQAFLHKKYTPYPQETHHLKGDFHAEMLVDLSVFQTAKTERQRLMLSEEDRHAIQKLKRCARCILPETFPFITFDESGVCNYCHNYHKKHLRYSKDDLVKTLEPYKKTNGQPDCLVPYSGGRDSTYVLHFVKKELGMKPIAFTYDWGMVTDLARRNAARVCGKLGVENIIVAADIRAKRRNIKLNVEAWLNKPHLGMVPLFMAGDKYFFYHNNRILNRYKLDLSLWGTNSLENTDFKTGFAGVQPIFNKKRIDELKLKNKLSLAGFFMSNFVTNPSYLNKSLFDTAGAFGSRYLIKRKSYVQLFDYINWKEEDIDNLILNEYEWEKSIDSPSTWRIGDGTAAFYNYIYYTVAGFSEFDTFRSNQVREGHINRDEALKLVAAENIPRFENLKWYLEILGLDFASTIDRINSIPKLYRRQGRS